jgi:hypothetical protein
MPKQETNILNIGGGRAIRIPVNYQHFILNYSSNPEDLGWKREEVIHILECVKEGRLEELDMDADLMNSIGTFFEEGVCVKPDINIAVYWYEQAIESGNDLARSNLADILRKGSQGYPKDLRRAFKLYKACGLPYAHYRVGEFYEHGWGVRQDLDAAKAYYRQAYREGHGLANKKLKEWNFLEGTPKNVHCDTTDEGISTDLKAKKYEVRCHEWGDGSDYHWCYCDTREEAVMTVKNFYAIDPNNTYEHLYFIEIKEDGSEKFKNIDN